MHVDARETWLLDCGGDDKNSSHRVADRPPLEVHDRRLQVGSRRDQVRRGRQLRVGLADGLDDRLGQLRAGAVRRTILDRRVGADRDGHGRVPVIQMKGGRNQLTPARRYDAMNKLAKSARVTIGAD